jgi:hypothetical protein
MVEVKKKLPTKMFLMFGSILVTLLLCVVVYEIVARIRYHQWREEFVSTWMGKVTIPSPNEKLMWEYRSYGVQGTLAFNRYGYRDIDYPTRKRPAGVYRVAFAGDSVTLGLGVLFHETLVWQYGVITRQKHPGLNLQAMNFAVDGYQTFHILEMIRSRIMAFEPNRVVYVMCLNDFILDGASGYKIEYFDPPTSFFLKKLEEFRFNRAGVEYHQYYYNKNHEDVFEAILEMRDVVQRAGSRFFVAIVPVMPNTVYAGGSFNNYGLRGMHREIDAFLEANRIDHLDLLDAFVKHQIPPKHFPNDVWHPNPAGHRLIAEALSRAIPLN